MAEVRRNAFHPLRKRFDEAVSQFIERLRSSPEVAARADALKDQFLNSAVIEEFVAGLWDSIRNSAARYASMIRRARARRPWHMGITSAGDSLLNNAELRAELDAVPHRPDRERGREAPGSDRGPGRPHRGRVGSGVAAKRLELAVGSDLQFIRINGTLVGGLVGVDTACIEDGALTAIANCRVPISK